MTRSARSVLLIALLAAAVLLAGALDGLARDRSSVGVPVGATPGLLPSSFGPAAAAGRDPNLWPFSRDSVWNLPLGANAVYVPANIAKPTAWGMTTDPDVLILTPSEPVTPVYYNSDAWGGGSRCDAQGGVLFSAPIPPDFVVPGAKPGDTPNFATAILMADGHTLVQGQPMARCTANGTATMWWYMENDLYGTGEGGGHGGSMLSSIGGTIRLGELVPGGVIQHAMKVNLDGAANLYYDGATRGYRWPATAADGCASSCYGGSNPALRMGSLLAIPPSVDVNTMGLETAPALILAKAFQDYGAYVVDNTGWSVYGIETEFSPQGRVEDEFQAAWSMPINPVSRDVPWARDMDRIFGTLGVVDDWDAGAWTQVSASNGTEGSGGGAPRVPWAPDFGSGSTPPPLSSTASFSGTAGLNGWYVSPVAVTITVTGGSGTVSIAYRIDGGPWVTYTQPFTLAEGRHVLAYQASDSAGDTEPARTAYVNADTTAPAIAWDPVAGGTIAPDGSLSWTGSDGGSGIAWYEAGVDGGAFQSVGLQTTLTQQWTEGSHSAIVRAYDAAGNTQSSTIQFNVAGSGSGGGPGGGSGTGTGSPTTSPGFSLRTPPGVPEALIGFALVILGLGLRPRGRSRRPISSR